MKKIANSFKAIILLIAVFLTSTAFSQDNHAIPDNSEGNRASDKSNSEEDLLVKLTKQGLMPGTKASKGPLFRLTVDKADALIHELTIGRGSGANVSNVAFGNIALGYNKGGGNNAAIGAAAMLNNISGSDNTAVGTWSLAANAAGGRNTAIGSGAMFFSYEGSENIAVGYMALYNNENGYQNTVIGNEAMSTSNETGYANTALGYRTLFSNTTGFSNVALGHDAMYFNTTGHYNTAVGYQALRGSETKSNNTGRYNTAIGDRALFSNTSGDQNTAIGGWALRDLTTGNENTAVCDYAGSGYDKINQGTFIGKSTFPNSNDQRNVTAIGYNAITTDDNMVRIGNSNVTTIGGYADWTDLSDERYKRNVDTDVAGLDFILKLRPVTYNLEMDALSKHLGENQRRDADGNIVTKVSESDLKAREAKAAIRYTGFVSQEVEAAAKAIGYDFSGVDAPQNKEGLYGLRYARFVVPIVKAIQEQQAQIELLEPAAVGALQEELTAVQVAHADLEASHHSMQEEQQALREENRKMRAQLNDILGMLDALGSDMQDCCNPLSSDNDHNSYEQHQKTSDQAWLEQNVPNPFNKNTLIRYYLPETFRNAAIAITDLNGNRVKRFTITEHGYGQILINGGTMTAGTYIYTLVQDGRRVDSKRMVLL